MFRINLIASAKSSGPSTASNTGKFQKQLNQVQNLFGIGKRRVNNINKSFSKEDYLKHRIIERYRTLYLNKQHLKRQDNLNKQFESIKEAMEALKNASPEHYQLAKNDKTRRFPVEYRVPTENPPNLIWATDYLKNKQFIEEQDKQ
ncbi:hypothetical protein QEN19_001053 [Hanseniaspora menglaensis]